jgi:hypothetical protein
MAQLSGVALGHTLTVDLCASTEEIEADLEMVEDVATQLCADAIGG